MVRWHFLTCALLAGCYGQDARLGGDAHDATSDVVAEISDVVADSSGEDVDTSVDLVCYNAPPCPDGPADGVLGRACVMDEECRDVPGAMCFTEERMEFEGEWYVTNPGGSCDYWADSEFCDPWTDEGCPEGSRCLSFGEFMGYTIYGCLDACSPGDASGEPFDWACGCRRGYRCDPSLYACVSGCTNDRECCERWVDEDEDYRRDDGEVTLFGECTSFCDGDDPEERTDCMASWSCVNPGLPGSSFGDPCDHDSQCPAGGECLLYTDPDSGEELFPGGYCTRGGCHLVGRGCEADGGWCLNFGTVDRPAGRCLRPCVTGLDLDDPEYGCRSTSGQQQACQPVPSLGWIGGPPPGGEDGFCFPGNFPGGPGELGERCVEDTECVSPLGLGSCMDWFGPGFCTVSCNESLAVDMAICGGAGVDGIATGLCGWSTCLVGCSGLGMPLGYGGCPRPDLACVPLSVLDSAVHVAEDTLKPPGFCMPACSSDAFCEEALGEGHLCDPVTGACS